MLAKTTNLAKTAAYTTVILVIIGAVFLAVSTGIQNIKATDYPQLSGVITTLQSFFMLPTAVFFVVFARIMYGVYRAQVNLNDVVKYDVAKAGKTITLYIGVIGSIAATLPPPYTAIGTAIATSVTVLGDVILSEIKSLSTPAGTTTTTPPTVPSTA